MISDSKRATSSRESLFRVEYPNSYPRKVVVALLDDMAENSVRDLHLEEGRYLCASQISNLSDSELWAELESADLLVMVAGPGGRAQAVNDLGKICQALAINSAALVFGGEYSVMSPLSETLAQLRPWVNMVIVAQSVDYLEGMLKALRA